MPWVFSFLAQTEDSCSRSVTIMSGVNLLSILSLIFSETLPKHMISNVMCAINLNDVGYLLHHYIFPQMVLKDKVSKSRQTLSSLDDNLKSKTFLFWTCFHFRGNAAWAKALCPIYIYFGRHQHPEWHLSHFELTALRSVIYSILTTELHFSQNHAAA